MPRRNIACLVLILVISLACYQRVPANRYGPVLAGVLDRVGRYYYQPIQDLALFEGAMQGVAGTLDKNSEYVPPARKPRFEEEINRQFGGIGINIWIDPKTNQLAVISPLPGTPAYEARILAGDRILKIDGQSTQGMTVDDARRRLRGKPGTPVVMQVLHEGETQPTDVTIVRRVIQEDTVLGDTRNPDGTWNHFLDGPGRIAYARITHFADAEKSDESGGLAKSTVADLKAVLQGLSKQGMRGLVLDLRDNPGGSLQAAVEMCDLFISAGEIVTVRSREGRIARAYRASGKAPFTDFPMAILVNENSASASEIVAACLQDQPRIEFERQREKSPTGTVASGLKDEQRAVIVGQQTYGKATVQELVDLGQAGMFKLTVATYWRPSGRNIHRNRGEEEPSAFWGVLPDDGFAVPLDKEEVARFDRWRRDRDMPPGLERVPASRLPPEEAGKPFVDRPLAKAVEYLRGTH
jgi:carboxyl-terminal processing protease